MAKSYYAELYFHFVWQTKRRQRQIMPELENQIWAKIVEKSAELGAFPIEVGGIEDHIHLLVSTEPTLQLSEFIGKLKGSTSHWINHDLQSSRVFHWGEGYGVLSLAKTNVDAVRKYIRNQKMHHDRNTFRPTMERIDRTDA